MRLLAAAAICGVAFTTGCGNGGRTTYTVGQSNWVTVWPSQPARAVDVTRARQIIDRNPEVLKVLSAGAKPSGSFVWLSADRRPPVVVLRFPLRRSAPVDAVVP